MTFFVDVNVLIYSQAASDYHRPCFEIIEAIGHNEADGRTSTAVMKELWHVELSGKAGHIDA